MNPAPNQSVYKKWLSEYKGNVFNRVPFGHLVILPNQFIISANSRITEWLSLEETDLIHKKRFADLISVGGRIFYETHHRPLEKIQGYISELNYTLVGKDRKRIPVLINTQQEKNESGEVLFTQFFIFDISERKEYEKELISAKKKAEEAAAAKDRFISTISHEIRTPLHGIIGTTDLLLQNQPTTNKEELVKILQFSTQSLLELINNILDFTKSEANKMRLHEHPFNLKDIVGNIVDIFKIKALEKGIAIQSAVDNNIPDLLIGDAIKLSQVLNNLIGNAIKFTTEGFVKVVLRLEQAQKQSIRIYVEIADSGVGIPSEKMQAIFAPFTQLEGMKTAKAGGTGLGLTISKQLVQLFGSELLLKSEVGKGSIFYFTIGLKIASKKDIASLPSLEEYTKEKPLSNIKVLLAEDNATNIYIAALYFKKWHLNFDVAENGKIALEMVQKNKYDLVLMDLSMPVMDGYESSQAIRNLPNKRIAQLPIIALTASTFSTIQEKAKKAGVTALISKPFKPNKLYELIQQYQKEKKSTTDSFEIDSLYEYFDKDAVAVQEFLEIVIEDFIDIKNNLFKAIENKDVKGYKDEKHKTLTTLKLLKASRLQDLLDQGNAKIASVTASSNDDVFKQLKKEFEVLIAGMENLVTTQE